MRSLLPILLFAACVPNPSDDDSGSDDDAADDDSSTWGDDDSTPSGDDDSTPPGDDDTTSPGDDDDSAAGGATLRGTITRTAALEEGQDGVGTLYLSIFDNDPTVPGGQPNSVGRTNFPDTDLTDPAAAVAYEIPGLSPRPEPYYAMAFFDDDGNADPMGPRPDVNDLVSMNGFSPPTVVVESEDGATLDLALSFALPF